MPPSPEILARTLQEFLCASRAAVVTEDGHQLFDLARARYSVSCEHGRCLLHLWSLERNVVRRVLLAVCCLAIVAGSASVSNGLWATPR